MVRSKKFRNWIIYSLPETPSVELDANLRCLQDCVQTEPVFKRDRKKLQNLLLAKDIQTLLNEAAAKSVKLQTRPERNHHSIDTADYVKSPLRLYSQ
jgi:hypothetical protein